jgi:hypothetical protein
MIKINEAEEEEDWGSKKLSIFDEMAIEKSIEESYISDLEDSTFYPIYRNIKIKQSDRLQSSLNTLSLHHKYKPKA